MAADDVSKRKLWFQAIRDNSGHFDSDLVSTYGALQMLLTYAATNPL